MSASDDRMSSLKKLAQELRAEKEDMLDHVLVRIIGERFDCKKKIDYASY